MADAKKQHYVPQFYLKQFASHDERLYAFNKFTKKSFQTRVRDAASEMRFYDIHPDFYRNLQANTAYGTAEPVEAKLLAKVLDPQLIEHELGVREATFAPVFSSILTSIEQKRRFTDEQRWRIAEFIAMQAVRTPDARRTYIDIRRSVFSELLRRPSKPAADTFSLEYDERYAELDHARLMFDPGFQNQLCLTLANHIWLIGENTTSAHFYTSDAPVTKRGYFTTPEAGVGWGSYGVEVTFPITPKLILILCERTAFPRLAQLDEHTVPLTLDQVAYYNSLQVILSYRSVYCPVGEFLLAAEVCAEHPEVCSPNPLRVQSSS